MRQPVNPAVIDLKREKRTARAKHAVDLGKRPILQFSAFQVMQNQDGDRRRKGLISKWQPRSVPTQRRQLGALVFRFQLF